jgi:hypothetical protein
VTIDLKADLNSEDDEGRNWARLSGALVPEAVLPSAVLRAGPERFRSWVHIDAVDADGQVHFHQTSADEARSAGAVSAAS